MYENIDSLTPGEARELLYRLVVQYLIHYPSYGYVVSSQEDMTALLRAIGGASYQRIVAASTEDGDAEARVTKALLQDIVNDEVLGEVYQEVLSRLADTATEPPTENPVAAGIIMLCWTRLQVSWADPTARTGLQARKVEKFRPSALMPYATRAMAR